MPAIIRNGNIYGASPKVPIDADEISYDNTSSELQSTNAQDAINELKELVDNEKDTTYTIGTDGNTVTLTPSEGNAQSITVPYATNAGTVNSHTVAADVPEDAVFTDTTYENATTATAGLMSPNDKVKVDALGTAAAKNFTTSVTSGSSDLVTSGAVYTAIDNLPEPMVFKGSLGTGGTITALPVNGSATIGDTYKVITAGTYAGKTAKIGDTFICLTKTSSANTWELIPSGDEPSGTVTSVGLTAGTGISVSGGPITTSGSITVTNSGVRSIATGTTNGTISVNTNGSTANVAVKGLGSAAYTDSTAYATSGHNHDSTYLKLSGGTMTGQIKLDDTGFRTSHNGGYSLDQYGNFNALNAATSSSSYFCMCDNGGTARLKMYWTSGNIETTGNVAADGSISIGNGCTLQYNSTNKCVDFVFV